MSSKPRHVLVVANETVAARTILNSLRDRREAGPIRVTVLCPVSQPGGGFLVYDDTRRDAAGRRLERTLTALRDAEIPAQGLVVESDPAAAVQDALAQDPADEVILSTHPEQRSGWLRRKVVDQVRSAAGEVPVEHVVVDLEAEAQEANVLVLANETVVGDPLLERIRERARQSRASFLIICPQSDPTQAEHPEAERRLRRALAVLRDEGIDAHGQVAHPDPYTAAMHAVHDERIDEMIVSTFPEQESGWLGRDLLGRLQKDAGVPVEHVVVARSDAAEAPA